MSLWGVKATPTQDVCPTLESSVPGPGGASRAEDMWGLPQGTHMDHHGMASAFRCPSYAFLQLVEGNDMLQSCSSRVGGFTKDSGSVCGGCRGLPAA